jgi:aspartate aminotransferase
LNQQNLRHDYAPVPGLVQFCDLVQKFKFGEDSEAVKSERITTVQSLSGTGALRLATSFLRKYLPPFTAAYVSDPTWQNHVNILNDAGFHDVRRYRYFAKASNSFDYKGALEDLEKAPRRSLIIFHACAHNPTGVDPTLDQWKGLSAVCKQREHVLLFDNAYQGYASGDPVRDAQSFNMFVQDGHLPLVCQSFAKNFSLYGERVGSMSVVCADKKEAQTVQSHVMRVIRGMYSSPPLYGARIVQTILGDKELKKQWERDVKEMADRIQTCRKGLVEELKALGSTRDWSHITNQIGMFAFTGLTPEQVDQLRDQFKIYMTRDGRISVAGINTNNLKYVAKAFHTVTSKH